jgi:hypothetical protein
MVNWRTIGPFVVLLDYEWSLTTSMSRTRLPRGLRRFAPAGSRGSGQSRLILVNGVHGNREREVADGEKCCPDENAGAPGIRWPCPYQARRERTED